MQSKIYKHFTNYLIYEDGRVFSLNRNKYLKPDIGKFGYHRVVLQSNGEVCKFLVHRLVAELFIDNSLNLPQVNHKDGNKANNSVFNLEWVTAEQNIHHAHRTGIVDYKGQNNPFAKLTKLVVLDALNKDIDWTKTSLARYLNISPAHALRLLKGIAWPEITRTTKAYNRRIKRI